MNLVRGIFMLAVGVFVLYRGWVTHTGRAAWFAYALGIVAIALGIYRITRKAPRPLP
jgi:uncharacterized membrane protein HdeD (DUF308 family)